MADNQSSYQQISQQNGSTFAQMIKKYDKEILSIPNLVELLKFSGKDAVGTLFFLDTLKNDPQAFDKYPFISSAIPYFDETLVELFIQKAEEIRKMEGIYPKSAKVAQDILTTYKEKRRQKLAQIKGVVPEDIKETELFVPTFEEKQNHPDTLFIEHGNPSYAVFYLLNTMVSSEIEYKKKKGEGISERDLIPEPVRSELSVSLQKFMGKYHYEKGRLYRFNVEKNGVYFMDESVLKEGKIIAFDPKRYFQIDGLIVDIKTNQVINLAGIDQKEEDAILNKIKDKKLTIKEEKNTRILMSDEKEIFVSREGKSLSIYDLMCRYKGKKYAEWLRQEQVLDVPNLVDVLAFAGSDMSDDMLKYLKSLKPKIKSKNQSLLDPLTHLFMAGYVPCYSPELTEKYTNLVNKLVPIDKNAPWNKKACVPEEIAIRLSRAYQNDKRKALAKEKGCKPEEISDLDILCVTSLEEQNMIKPYYRSDEEICTLRSTTRYKEQYMINAVKRNIDDIKREKFKDPVRDDEYGTSCISIQIPVRGGNLDIKNRYNHTIRVLNPDKTFDANPDNISKGFLSSLESRIPVEFNAGDAPIPYYHAPYGNCLFEYDMEVGGVYFSKTHYLRRGAVHKLSDGVSLNAKIYISNDGDVFPTSLYPDGALQRALLGELENKKVEIKTNQEGVSTLFADGEEVAKIKDGEFISLHLKKTQQLGEDFLSNAPYLEEFVAPNLMTISEKSLKNAPRLKRLEIPNLIYADYDFLKGFPPIEVNAPMVFEKGSVNRLDQKPLYGDVARSISHYLSKEFENKKIDMTLSKDRMYHIFADGREVVEATYTGEITGLNLEQTPFPYMYKSEVRYISAPLTKTIDAYSLVNLKKLKQLDLENCYYISGTDDHIFELNEMIKKGLKINAPHVYDEKEGILIGSVFKRLSPQLKFHPTAEEEFNKIFFGKKISVEQEGDLKYLLADGKRVATYDENKKGITKLELEGIEEFDTTLINDSCFMLDELSLPDTKRIKAKHQYLCDNVMRTLKKINVPKLEGFVDKGILLFENMPDLTVNWDKKLLEKNGLVYKNGFILDTKNQIIIPLNKKYSAFFHLLNGYFEKAKDYEGEPVASSVDEKGDITRILLNGKEVVAFKGDDVLRVDLSYVEYMPPTTMNDFPALEEIKMDNLISLDSNNIYNCPKLKRISLPKLEAITWNSISSLDACEEIYLPKLKEVGGYCFSDINPEVCQKISVPELVKANLNSSFEQRGYLTKIPIETNYFKKNNIHKFGHFLINFETKEVFPRGYRRFSGIISDELKDSTVHIEEKEGVRYLCADGKPVLREENGEITGAYLEKTEMLSIDSDLKYLKEVVAPNATKVSSFSFNGCESLERVVADNVTEISNNCFMYLPNLKDLSLKKLQKTGDNCFYSLPKLEQFQFSDLTKCGEECFCSLDKTEKIKFNKLENCGDKCFSRLSLLRSFEAVSLKSMGEDSLLNTPCLEDVHAPLLQNRLEHFKDHPNKRQILKNMKKGRFTNHIMHAGFLAK